MRSLYKPAALLVSLVDGCCPNDYGMKFCEIALPAEIRLGVNWVD
jgi:hypothetical protein